MTAFLCFASFLASAQCSGRFYDEIFTAKETRDVNFGRAENKDLNMHIFQPEGDTASRRPLIILAFGGSFTAGFKDSPDIRTLCQEFARRGYVTATIDYRLNTGVIDSANMLKQVIKAVQDAKAAIRFFYKDAATTNTYRIDTNHIFMGGTSAGAFIGIHLGYVTDTLNLPQWMKEIIASVGDGLEGNSGNPGYSSRIHGIINLAGAIGDTAWIEPGEIPMVSMHGDQDGTVPYCSEIISVSGNELIVVDGSATMKARTARLGIFNPFYTWRNADHVPYVNPLPPPFSNGPLYMDTTVWFIRDFLFKIMTGSTCGQPLAAVGKVSAPCGYPIVEDTAQTGITQHIWSENFAVYPNPSSNMVYVEKPSILKGAADVEIYNNIGKLVKSIRNVESKIVLSKDELGSGLFIVTLIPHDKNFGAGRTQIVLQ
ncbi:MAG TPA: T9SS type A sorting domain-containing protein [Chitinophagales bacterium]|nr:T9SS type A sorting domain-containing protein [Chitinophagales bacterium]